MGVKLVSVLFLVGVLCGIAHASYSNYSEGRNLHVAATQEEDFLELEDDAFFRVHDASEIESVPSTSIYNHYGVNSSHMDRNLHKKTPVVTSIPVMPRTQPTNIIRVETQKVVRELSCPEGTFLVNRQCVGRQVLPPQSVCPPYFRLVEGRCVSSMRATPECAPGHSLIANRCVSCSVEPAEMICPEDYSETSPCGNFCSKTISSPPMCPSGFELEDGECRQYLPGSIECPQDYHLEDGACVRHSTLQATVVCPDGAELDAETQKCIIVRQDAPRCPRKFSFNPTFGTCVQQIATVPGSCPRGYTQNPSGCTKVEYVPAEPRCPEGTQFDGQGNCTREIATPARCPAGYQHSNDAGHQCDKISREIASCPPDTQVSGDGVDIRCERVIQHSLTECCPPGYEMVKGQCEREEVSPSLLSCDGECYKTRVSPVSYTCPHGYEFVDDFHNPVCVLNTGEETKCRTAPAFVPPSRCMHMDSSLRSSEAYPECFPPTPPPCEVIPARREVLPAQPFCRDGGYVEDNNCVVKTPIVPERRCVSGTLDLSTGQCVRVVVAQVTRKCPEGTVRQGLQCFSREPVPPVFDCPAGMMSGPQGSCIARTAAIMEAPTVESVPASYVCTSGTIVSDRRSCALTSKIGVDMVCPPETQANYAVDGTLKCLLTAEMVIPAAIEKTVRPSYICNDGSRANVKTCFQSEYVEPSLVCPKDSFPVANSRDCVRVTPLVEVNPRVLTVLAKSTCSRGVARGGMCIVDIDEAVEMVCPPDHQLKGDRCIKVTDLETFCPEGTIKTREGCILEIVQTPFSRVVKGCVHDVTSSCTGCPRVVQSQCHGNH